MCGGDDFIIRFEKLYKNLPKFIDDTIRNAIKYDYDGYYLDSDLTYSVIKIKSIRKYKHKRTQWNVNQEQYVYEIDVIVDMRPENNYLYYGTNRYCQKNARRYNKYYRRAILGAVIQELKYFGIDNFEMNVEISKIEYKEI